MVLPRLQSLPTTSRRCVGRSTKSVPMPNGARSCRVAATVVPRALAARTQVGALPRGWTIAAQLRAAEGVAAGDRYDPVRLHGDGGPDVVDIAPRATEGSYALMQGAAEGIARADVSPGDATKPPQSNRCDGARRSSSPRLRSSTLETGASVTQRRTSSGLHQLGTW
jgi:hypothetical protein